MILDWTQIIIAALTLIGGWEGLMRLMNFRTAKKRDDFALMKEMVEFDQKQLQEKEERFVDQTNRLRKVQDDYFELMKKQAQTELELQKYRCVVPKCLKREPQNGY